MELKKPKILFLHSAGPQHGDEGSSRLLSFIHDQLSPSFEIVAPRMPHPDQPDYESWRNALREIFKILDNDTILIGHSLGGSVLLKYLSEEPVDQRIRALYLVAVPFWGLDGWEVDEFKLGDDFAARLPEITNIIIYQSEDDQTVTSDHADEYASMIPSAEYYSLNGYGHVYWNGLPHLIKHLKQLAVQG